MSLRQAINASYSTLLLLAIKFKLKGGAYFYIEWSLEDQPSFIAFLVERSIYVWGLLGFTSIINFFLKASILDYIVDQDLSFEGFLHFVTYDIST